MNSTHTGKLGEVNVAAYFSALGYDIFLPAFSEPQCDMIVCKGKDLKRIQVKATDATGAGGNYVVHLRKIRNNGRHSKIHKFDGECADVLAVFIVQENRVALFDAKLLNGRNCMTIARKGLATRYKTCVQEMNFGG